MSDQPAEHDTTPTTAPEAPASTEEAKPAAAQPAEVDELERVTAQLRQLNARKSLRWTQVALIVVMALIVGALIAPLVLLGGPRTEPGSAVPAGDPAVTALQAWERTIDGTPATPTDQATIAQYVHVRTNDTGDTVATALSPTGQCFVITVPSAAGVYGAGRGPGIVTGQTTDCS